MSPNTIESALALLSSPHLANEKQSIAAATIKLYRFEPGGIYQTWSLHRQEETDTLRCLVFNVLSGRPDQSVDRVDCVIDQVLLDSMLTALHSISIPIAHTSQLPSHFTSHGIEVSQPDHAIDLRWTGPGPLNWDPVHQWFEKTVSRLESLLGGSIPQRFNSQ